MGKGSVHYGPIGARVIEKVGQSEQGQLERWANRVGAIREVLSRRGGVVG